MSIMRHTTIKYLSVSLILSLTIVFLAQIFATSYNATIVFSMTSTKEWLVTSLPITLIFILVDCLTGKKYISIGPIACLIIILAAISGQKYGYRSEPLYPWDFLFINQTLDLLPVLIKERPNVLSTLVITAILSTASIGALVYHLSKGLKLPPQFRIKAGIVSVLLLSLSLYSLSPFGTLRLYKATGIMNMAWDQPQNYQKNGFLLAFSFNLNSALVKKPKTDIGAALSALSAAGEPPALSETKPDIVIVMNESFWDPTKLPGTTFSPDPMPTVRAFQKGEIFSPVYGGGTANVEFEALTGFSNAFLPTGSLPYQQYVEKDTPSIVWALKAFGYRSVAMHPYHRWFWNRENVYSKFGFDKFVSLEQLPEHKTRGLFFSDEALSEEILKELKQKDQPTILFAITMQNHGPYEKSRYPENTIRVDSTFELGTLKEESLQTYAHGIRDGDNGLKLLISELSKRERPTLLIFFGDHLPMMGQNFEVFKDTGFVQNSPNDFTIPEMMRIRTTPLVIWSNTQTEYKNQGIISPSFIPNIIDNAVGLQNKFYGLFLGAVRKEYSVVDQKILGHASGQREKDWRGKSIELIDSYQAIQYDLMFGKESSLKTLFPDFDKRYCSPPDASLLESSSSSLTISLGRIPSSCPRAQQQRH
ncbi:LTA synthase family protein [Pseudomonas syringae]